MTIRRGEGGKDSDEQQHRDQAPLLHWRSQTPSCPQAGPLPVQSGLTSQMRFQKEGSSARDTLLARSQAARKAKASLPASLRSSASTHDETATRQSPPTFDRACKMTSQLSAYEIPNLRRKRAGFTQTLSFPWLASRSFRRRMASRASALTASPGTQGRPASSPGASWSFPPLARMYDRLREDRPLHSA